MTVQKLKGRIRMLTVYSILSTVVFLFLFVSLYNKTAHLKADELTVKRINLIGEDGSLRMVISNESRQHPGRIDGKDLPKRERPAGILFFDNNGNECGGLVYNESNTGNKVNKMMSFTMDNYKNDQIVQMIDDETYHGDQAVIRRGLAINEFPVGADMGVLVSKMDSLNKAQGDTAIRHQQIQALFKSAGSKRRLFLGRTGQNESGIFLYDNAGRPRLEIYVDSLGDPKMMSLDSAGNTKKWTNTP